MIIVFVVVVFFFAVSFLPRPLYYKQGSLDRLSRHVSSIAMYISMITKCVLFCIAYNISLQSGSSSSADEGSLTSRRQAFHSEPDFREPPSGFRVEIKKRSDIFHDPHVPDHIAEVAKERKVEEQEKRLTKSAPRRSVALPVVQFGVGVMPAVEPAIQPPVNTEHQEKPKPSKPPKPSIKEKTENNQDLLHSDQDKDESSATSRPRTQALLHTIQEQVVLSCCLS